MLKAHEKSIDAWVRKTVAEGISTRREVPIDGRPGLFVAIEPSGKVFWLGRYQVGKGKARNRKRTSLGRYGEGGLTLNDAAVELSKLTSAAEKGSDLLAEQKTKAQVETFTLRHMFNERKKRDTRTAARTLADYEAVLTKHVFEKLGDRAAAEIKPEEFAMLLLRMEKGDPDNRRDKGSKHRTHKIRSALGSTYQWAQRHYPLAVPVNPVKGLAFTHQSERRKRVLTDDELGRLWSAAASFEGIYEPTRQIIRLAMLTGQRNSEVAGIEMAELRGLDTATPRWDIPARRMKRKSDDQYVPLSTQAAAIVRDAVSRVSGDESYVFPGTTHGRRANQDWQNFHIAQDTVSHAFARLAKEAKVKNVRLHDMRKCITSWLAENGLATPEVLDAILHHARKGVTGSHYNFALYEGQVRKALQAWADHVEEVAAGVRTKANNVVAIRA